MSVTPSVGQIKQAEKEMLTTVGEDEKDRRASHWLSNSNSKPPAAATGSSGGGGSHGPMGIYERLRELELALEEQRRSRHLTLSYRVILTPAASR